MSRYCEKDETTILPHVALKIFIVIYSPKATGFRETAQDERKSQQQEENNQSVYLFHVGHSVSLNEGYMCNPMTHSTHLVMYTCICFYYYGPLERQLKLAKNPVNSTSSQTPSISFFWLCPTILREIQNNLPKSLHLTFTLNVDHKMKNMFLRSCILAEG